MASKNPEHIGPTVGRVMDRIASGHYAETVICVLPEPPAANRYLRQHGPVTYKTREAKEYCATVAALTAQYRTNGQPCFPTGDVTCVVVWHRTRKAGDLGERTKCLYDALQGTIYTNDKQIAQDWRRRVDAHPTVPKGHVLIEVCPIENSAVT